MKTIQNLQSSIIFIALIIFGLISGITTALGVNLVLISLDPYLRWTIAVGIAIGTTLVMIYLGLRVPEAARSGKLFGVALGYSFIALISVFFNFHTFYGTQSKQVTLEKDAKIVRRGITEMAIQSRTTYKQHYGIEELEKKADNKKAEMDSEKYHYNRPGEGEKYHKLKEEWTKLKNQLSTNRENLNSDLKAIQDLGNGINGEIEEALNLGDDEHLKEKILSGESIYEQIASSITTLDPNFVVKELKINYSNIERPEYSFGELIDYFTSEESTVDSGRFYLSLFFSFLLDFPIFITLLIIGGKPEDNSVDGQFSKPTSINQINDKFNVEERKKKFDSFW